MSKPWTTPIWIIRPFRFQKEKQTWRGKKLYIATEPWAEASLLTIKVSIGKSIQNKPMFMFYSWRKERGSRVFPSLSCAEHQMCLNREYEKRRRGKRKEGHKSKPGLESDRRGSRNISAHTFICILSSYFLTTFTSSFPAPPLWRGPLLPPPNEGLNDEITLETL